MVDMSVNGPPDETEYYLDDCQLPSDRHDEVSRSLTEEVLAVSPREVADVRVWGIPEWLRDTDDDAVDTLVDGGVPVIESAHDSGTLLGRCSATPAVVEAVLSLYSSGLWHAHFIDERGYGIAARYDGHAQHYWLPESNAPRLAGRVESEVFDALVTTDE